MRLAGDFHQKKFRKISKIIFPQFSVFFKGLRLRKMGFLLFPVGEEFFRDLWVSLRDFLAL